MLLDLPDPFLGQGHYISLFIDNIVILVNQAGNKFGDAHIEVGRFVAFPGNNQRGTGLIDQDRVDFVDDGVIEGTLNHVIGRHHHIVTQVIETQFVIGAKGNVAGISGFALGVGQVVDDQAYRQAAEFIYRSHPSGITAGQVVIDGNDVDAFTL